MIKSIAIVFILACNLLAGWANVDSLNIKHKFRIKYMGADNILYNRSSDSLTDTTTIYFKNDSIGIFTASPSARLDINGNIKIPDSTNIGCYSDPDVIMISDTMLTVGGDVYLYDDRPVVIRSNDNAGNGSSIYLTHDNTFGNNSALKISANYNSTGWPMLAFMGSEDILPLTDDPTGLDYDTIMSINSYSGTVLIGNSTDHFSYSTNKLAVLGDAFINSTLRIADSLNVGKDIYIGGYANIDDSLKVTGPIKILGNKISYDGSTTEGIYFNSDNILNVNAPPQVYYNNRANIIIKDPNTTTQGVGGGIRFDGSYTGTTSAEFAGINAYKANSTDGNFSSEMRFQTRKNGGNLIDQMVIDSNGYMGIGTTTPTSLLDVRGKLTIQGTNGEGVILNRSGGGGYIKWLDGSGSNQWIMNHSNTNNGIILQPQISTGYFGLYDYVDSKLFYVNCGTGYIGIGTSSPTAKLEVNGTSKFNDAVALGSNYLSRTGSTSQGLYFGSTNTGIIIADPEKGGEERKSLTCFDNNAMAAGVGGGIGFGGYIDGTTYSTFGSIKGVKANSTSGNYEGQLHFITRASYASRITRMLLDQNGNLGVGTTSPTAMLDVNGSSEFNGIMDVNNGISLDTNHISYNGNDTFGINLLSDNIVKISNVRRKLLDAEYNLDIVDKYPYVATGVGGGISFSGVYNSSLENKMFACIKGYKKNSTSGDQTGELRFITVNNGSPLTRMTIDDSGFVGIGTTNPDAQLVIVKSPDTVRITAKCYGREVLAAMNLRGGVNDPDMEQLGTSTLYQPAFDGTTTMEQGFGTMRYHAAMKKDTIWPYITYAPRTTGSGNFKFHLYYNSVTIGDAITSADSVLVTVAASGTAYQSGIAWFNPIVINSTDIGILFRLFRDPGDAADTYAADVFIASIGFEFKINKLGGATALHP